MDPLNIAFVSPEVVPFAKTGGLADVAGALPAALAGRGHIVKVFMPLYKMIDVAKFGIGELKTKLGVAIADRQETFDLHELNDQTSGCAYYFIKMDKYFARDGLYVSPQTGKDWEDNDERFIALSRAVLESLKAIDFRPDIIHCNDWQSGLIPAYLRCADYGKNYFANARTIFTIHNIAYQGIFPPESFSKLGLDQKLFYPMSGFEYYGQLCYLKAGIH